MNIKKSIREFVFSRISRYYSAKKRIKISYYQYLYSPALKLTGSLSTGANFNLSITNKEDANLVVAEGVEFRNFCNVLVMDKGQLTIGRNVFFNNYCSLNCMHSILIGENSIFGENIKIYDHDHQYSYQDNLLLIARNHYTRGKVKIGRNCWIGSNVTILKNVEIGDNVIIGANNLIYKSIPANSIVKAKSDPVIQLR